MIDLKRLNAGIKLIKHILKTSAQTNQPWANDKQLKSTNKQKNTKPRR